MIYGCFNLHMIKNVEFEFELDLKLFWVRFGRKCNCSGSKKIFKVGFGLKNRDSTRRQQLYYNDIKGRGLRYTGCI